MQYPVVGVFEPRPGFTRFASGGLLATEAQSFPELLTIVESIVRADLSRDGVLGILGDPSADDVSIDMPSGLGLLDRVAAGEWASRRDPVSVLRTP